MPTDGRDHPKPPGMSLGKATLLAALMTVVLVTAIGVGIFWNSGAGRLQAEKEGHGSSRAASQLAAASQATLGSAVAGGAGGSSPTGGGAGDAGAPGALGSGGANASGAGPAGSPPSGGAGGSGSGPSGGAAGGPASGPSGGATSGPSSGPSSGPASRSIDGTTTAPTSQALGADRLDLNLVSQGQQVFVRSCVMCHGSTGQGVAKLGNSLAGSAWVRGADLSEVAEVIQNGRSANDPANRLKVPMPARGGIPSLTENEINALAAYCKSLAK